MGKVKTANVLPDEGNGDIIEERGNPYHAKDGKFTFGKVRMSEFERKHISSYIITNFPELVDGSTHVKEIGDYFYAFSVKEPGTYSFFVKIKISKRNSAKINYWRNMLDD